MKIDVEMSDNVLTVESSRSDDRVASSHSEKMLFSHALGILLFLLVLLEQMCFVLQDRGPPPPRDVYPLLM